MFVLPRSAPPDQSVSDVSTRTVVDLLFTRPAVAITVVIATLVVTRIARGVLRRVVRRVADRNGVQPELSLWRVRVRLESAQGNAETFATVEATPPGYGRWDLLVYLLPFLAIGVLWAVAMLRRIKRRTGARHA